MGDLGTDAGDGIVRVALVTITRSTASADSPLAASALPPAAMAISTSVSSGAAQRRSAMPTRVRIHSSVVSIVWDSSSLVTRRRGR